MVERMLLILLYKEIRVSNDACSLPQGFPGHWSSSVHVPSLNGTGSRHM